MDSTVNLRSDTIYIVFSQILASALRLCVYILVGRSSGTSALGAIVFCFAIIEIVHNVILLGFDRAVIRFGSPAFANRNFNQFFRVFWLCLKVLIVISCLIVVAGIIYLQVTSTSIIPSIIRQLLIIAILILPVLVIMTIIENSFGASGSVMYYGLFMVLPPFLWLILAIAAVSVGASLVAILYSYATAIIIFTSAVRCSEFYGHLPRQLQERE